MSQTQDRRLLERTLKESWRREWEAARLYRLCAERETDERRRRVFTRLAQLEADHARWWQEKLQELGVAPPDAPTGDDLAQLTPKQALDRIEAVERGNAEWYQSLRQVLDDPSLTAIIDRIDRDEAQHADLNLSPDAPAEPVTRGRRNRLQSIWGEERWHRQSTGDWVGDAIYGVNDGLGAIFGIIAGVAGYTDSSQTVLISGFFGALASTLSMAAGAWLATKSENELMETEMAHERAEIAASPEHELEELALLYELKGFSSQEAAAVARRIAANPDQFLETMAQEELGIHETNKGNPWKSALFGGLSTFIGAIIPLVPFFFLSGPVAMGVAAAVSLAAHFAVGAAKSLITVRPWWASGFEMTMVGLIVGVVSYGLGMLGSVLLG
ncbi:VIT1/CCC1 transporter family protein [Alicyclobacillus kakegawensis]|uniref:VIT1/CCC1 transporter family protein n=1 Tax=Alicyclobacillus kakegawensis TaxID=392012 RepID=UPI000A90BEAF|nr:VIT1/CCC1 transporter family protein [Alicyclobacillus kakegawensis]